MSYWVSWPANSRCMLFLLKTNYPFIEKLIALTQQVKYLAECVEKITNTISTNTNEPYGVPGSSRAGSGSQQEPIILSDDDIMIKTEKDTDATTATTTNTTTAATTNTTTAATTNTTTATTTNTTTATTTNTTASTSGKRAKKASDKTAKKTVSSKDTKDKNPKKAISGKAKGKAPVRSSSSSSSSDGSSSSSNSSSLNSSKIPFYLKKNDMPKDLREALRVNKDITNLLVINLLTDIVGFI